MTYGNFAALAQKNFKRMLAYSSIAHAGYMLVGVAAAGVSTDSAESAGSVLFYLVIYAFSNRRRLRRRRLAGPRQGDATTSTT